MDIYVISNTLLFHIVQQRISLLINDFPHVSMSRSKSGIAGSEYMYLAFENIFHKIYS